MDKERFDKGLAVRKEVLGKEYVEKALTNATEFMHNSLVILAILGRGRFDYVGYSPNRVS